MTLIFIDLWGFHPFLTPRMLYYRLFSRIRTSTRSAVCFSLFPLPEDLVMFSGPAGALWVKVSEVAVYGGLAFAVIALATVVIIRFRRK